MQPATLHARQRRQAQFGIYARQALCRHELREAAMARQEHLRQVESASSRIATLLPGACDAGLTIDEIVQLSGYSRASVYRLISGVRGQRDLAAEFAHYAEALHESSETLGHAALLFDLATALDEDMDQLMSALAHLVTFAVERFDSLDSARAVGLVDRLPELPENEKIALAMALHQRLTLSAIAASMQRPEVEVGAWIALGLLRVLPKLEAEVDGR